MTTKIMIVAGLLVQLAAEVVRMIHTQMQVDMGQRIVYALREQLLAHLQALPLRRHVTMRTAASVYRLDADAYCVDDLVIGGIFPLAALVARDDLDVAGDVALGHYTHEKNPVACAAALATIEVIEKEGLVEKSRKLGEHALNRLRAMKDRYELIGDVRGLGLMLGMELVLDRSTKQRANDEAEQIMYQALDRGLSFKLTMGNIITLTPPLTISQQEMDRALDILEECLSLSRISHQETD